jgi:hypothetical protein
MSRKNEIRATPPTPVLNIERMSSGNHVGKTVLLTVCSRIFGSGVKMARLCLVGSAHLDVSLFNWIFFRTRLVQQRSDHGSREEAYDDPTARADWNPLAQYSILAGIFKVGGI